MLACTIRHRIVKSVTEFAAFAEIYSDSIRTSFAQLADDTLPLSKYPVSRSFINEFPLSVFHHVL